MFLILRACLLFGLVSLHVVGGAVLFRRFFPRESPWLGFIVPMLAVVTILSFIEHLVAIPSLRWALPMTCLGSIWALLGPVNWRVFRLPTGIFLGAFAFTLLLRALRPDISVVRDGILDLHLIANYCMGGTLPATSTWLPPVQLTGYYAFQHYGASVLIRLLGIDIGTGFNVASALVSAEVLFLCGAIAWRLSRQRAWVSILTVILTACAATGSTAYLYFYIQNMEPENTANLFDRMEDPALHVPLFKWLVPVPIYDRRELFVPGRWAWVGVFHSTSAGQMLTLLSSYSLIEIFQRRRTDWSWIVLLSAPLLMLVTASWGVPLLAFFAMAGVVWAWAIHRRPRNLQITGIGIGAVATCLTPMLLYFLAAPFPAQGWVRPEQHTQVLEFLVQWWPVFLPWVAFFFFWPRLHPAVRIVHALLPICFFLVESYTFGARFDMTGKSWGFLYAPAWAMFLPVLMVRRGWVCGPILTLIVINSALSLLFWTSFYNRVIWPEDQWQLAGWGAIRTDHKKLKIIRALQPLQHQTILTGKSNWEGCNSPMLANLTGNSEFVTWAYDCDVDVYRDTGIEAGKREKIINAIYDGKSDDPLPYLRKNHIAALVVWPDDNLPDASLARMKEQLAPDYDYTDFLDNDTPDPPNAGIFLRRETP